MKKLSLIRSGAIALIAIAGAFVSPEAAASTCRTTKDIGNLSCRFVHGQHGQPGFNALIICKKLVYPRNARPPVHWVFTGRRGCYLR